MKKQKLRLSALLTVLFCTGCSILSTPGYKEVADYDLRIPSTNRLTPAMPMRFGVFSNLSGAGTRMLQRENTGKVSIDEYNRWLLLPEQLLRRVMIELFETASDRDAGLQIHCQILRFEIDADKAVFEAEYLLRGKDREERRMHRFETPLKDKSGDAVSAAMSENVMKSAQKLCKEIAAFASAGSQEKKQK